MIRHVSVEAKSMMSLEMFNEHVLPGKTVEELYELIENFKIEKIFLKVQIEKENIADFNLPPTEMVSKIESYRLYIRDTYKQIEEIGGTIERAEDEEFAMAFQENVSTITQIHYQVDGEEEYYVAFETAMIDKSAFLEEFADLHVGEWREMYRASDYGEEVADGTSWSLKVQFDGEMKPAEFAGINVFPYNFGLLDQLIKKAFD